MCPTDPKDWKKIEADRPPTQLTTYNHHRMIMGSRNRKRTLEIHQGRPNINETSERLFQSPWGTGWEGGQSLRRLWGEHAVIYQSFSGLPK